VSYQFQRIRNSYEDYCAVPVKEMYSYTPDGRLAKKRMQLQDTLYGTGGAVINLDASLNYL